MRDTVKIDKRGVRLIAHRGLSGIEQENTCAAFIAAANRESYYGIETDTPHRRHDGLEFHGGQGRQRALGSARSDA